MKTVRIRDLDPLLIKGVNFNKEDAGMVRKTGYIPLLRANNINNMRINFDEVMYVKSAVVKGEQYLQDGDVIFVTSSGSKRLVGKSALVSNLPEPTTIGAFNSLLRFPKDIDPRYAFYALNSPSFRAHIGSRLAGANINNIKKDDILDFELAVPFKGGKPNLIQQKRIAEELDKVSHDVANALRVLARQRALTNSLKQSTLVKKLVSEDDGRTLEELEDAGIIVLGRGKVISAIDIAAESGTYPVYSAAQTGNGEFGRYGRYAFDEELITWSVDGGGKFFYRPKHRFSITNVSGFVRILDNDALDYKYLYYVLTDQWLRKTFDYINKAHPSNIRGVYKVPMLPLKVQRDIVDSVDKTFATSEKLEHLFGNQEKSFAFLRSSTLNQTFTMQT